LNGIARSVVAGRWFPPGSHAVDEHLEFRCLREDLVSMYGIGQISTPRGSNPCVIFTELWQRIDDGWKVLHLHYHRHVAQQRG